MSLFADDMIVYTEKPKDSTKKLLGLINEFGKLAGYEINIKKSVAFFYTSNERSGTETKQAIPFTMATKILRDQ